MLKTKKHSEEAAQATSRGKITSEFFEKTQATLSPLPSPRPVPVPVPFPRPINMGSRFMIWKQDPTVRELGCRLTFIPHLVLDGPRDARIATELPGTTPVVRNATGDFIFSCGTNEADCANTYALVRQTLTMYEHARGGQAVPWAWNRNGNTDPLMCFPHGFSGANAFYSRTQKALQFGHFVPSGSTAEVFTCRSLDIISHECGHAVLDGLKPGWLAIGNPPQTGGLHEAFGDLTAIFVALAQLDQVEAFIAMTKADLHKKNFLAEMAEEFGVALGRSSLRNADNDLKLSQVSNEVHALSQVFTGGVYDILADIFAFEKNRQRDTKSPGHVLLDISKHVQNLLLNAIIQAPDAGATYADVVNQMLAISHSQGDPPIYRTFIRNRFTFREVVVSPTPLTALASGTINMTDPNFVEGEDHLSLGLALPSHPSLVAAQDRSGCCGTMQLPEYVQSPEKLHETLRKLIEKEPISEMDILADEIEQLRAEFSRS